MKNHNLPKCILLIILSSFLMFSCGEGDSIVKEIKETAIDPEFPEAGSVIITSLYGRIVDGQGEPISEAEVLCHTCVTELRIETDEKGYFLFEEVEHQGTSAYVSVSYPKTFKAFRRLGVIPNKLNYTEIQLNEKTNIGTLSSDVGGLLTHSSTASVNLPANGIADADGNAYSGDYEVFMSWIRPDADNLSQNMVGDFSGIDVDNNVVALTTYGMLVVELLDDQGNELNLQTDNIATLKFPVPDDLIGNAPETIPLWSYNEEFGYWVEEGQANLVDNFYVGDVPHFSAWNVDYKGPAIDISGTISVTKSGQSYGASFFAIQAFRLNS